jgi:uncharacterized Zn-binding protein involved in type VI secretion
LSALLAARVGDRIGSHGSGFWAGVGLFLGLLAGAALGGALIIMTGGIAAPAVVGALLMASTALGAVAMADAGASMGEKLGESYDNDSAAKGNPCGKVTEGFASVFVENLQVARVDEPVDDGHSKMDEGSATVLVGGKPFSRVGDASSCGGHVISGARYVTVGGHGQKSGGHDATWGERWHDLAAGCDDAAALFGKGATWVGAAAIGAAALAGAGVLAVAMGAGLALTKGLAWVGEHVGGGAGALIDAAAGYTDHRYANFLGAATSMGLGFMGRPLVIAARGRFAGPPNVEPETAPPPVKVELVREEQAPAPVRTDLIPEDLDLSVPAAPPAQGMGASSLGLMRLYSSRTVREIGRGETVSDLAGELASRTRETGWEHAIVIMKDGTRRIVTSEQEGEVKIPEGTRRLIAHTHPNGARFASPEDKLSLGTFGRVEDGGQGHSYVIAIEGEGHGIARFEGVHRVTDAVRNAANEKLIAEMLAGFEEDLARKCSTCDGTGPRPPAELTLDTRHVQKHLPDTPQSAKLVRKEGAAHVFKDEATMQAVAAEIRAHGKFLGSIRGHDRWGLQFEEPIGYRVDAKGNRIPLTYGEMKVGPDGKYHVIPRTKASAPSEPDE